MQPSYWLLAQTILTEPEHQGIALGAIVVGVIAGILIALGILIPPALVLWKKFKPAIQEFGKSISTIAATPSAPEPKAYGEATRDAIAPLIDTVKELVTENKTLRETAEDRAAMIAGQNDRITRLEQQAEKDKQLLQTQIDSQCALIEKQNARVDALQATIENQKKELQTKDAAIAERDEQLKEYQALKLKVDELTAEVARLKAQLQMQEKLQIELQAAQETIKAKDAIIEKLSTDLRIAEDKLKQAQDALATEQRLHALHEQPPAPTPAVGP